MHSIYLIFLSSSEVFFWPALSFSATNVLLFCFEDTLQYNNLKLPGGLQRERFCLCTFRGLILLSFFNNAPNIRKHCRVENWLLLEICCKEAKNNLWHQYNLIMLSLLFLLFLSTDKNYKLWKHFLLKGCRHTGVFFVCFLSFWHLNYNTFIYIDIWPN